MSNNDTAYESIVSFSIRIDCESIRLKVNQKIDLQRLIGIKVLIQI